MTVYDSNFEEKCGNRYGVSSIHLYTILHPYAGVTYTNTHGTVLFLVIPLAVGIRYPEHYAGCNVFMWYGLT
jgi:hypothetical protein